LDKKHYFIFAALFAILLISIAASSMVGASSPAREIQREIIWQIRFPRIMLALFVGAGLATCGAVFQGLLRNPLAEPYTLGISGGAALGVTIGVVSAVSGVYLSFFALAGSALSILLIYSVAAKKRFSNSTLILGGVILNFVFSSLVFLIFSVARAEDVHGVILWLMGDLASAQISTVKLVPLFVIPAVIILFIFSRDLNILTLGEEKALHLGVNSKQVKKLLFLLASCITGASVAAAGVIGFVGLIIPHFIRKIAGVDHRIVLPASCLAGASFLIISDMLARIIIWPLELPVGVITGIFGGIFFLGFLLKSKRWELF